MQLLVIPMPRCFRSPMTAPPLFLSFQCTCKCEFFLQERVCKDKGDRTVETEIMSACVPHTHTQKRKDGESKMEKAEKKEALKIYVLRERVLMVQLKQSYGCRQSVNFRPTTEQQKSTDCRAV